MKVGKDRSAVLSEAFIELAFGLFRPAPGKVCIANRNIGQSFFNTF